MTLKYLDPSAGTNGTGSQANPLNTAVGLVLAAGDSLLIKTGTTLREGLPSTMFVNGSNTVGYYGTGAKPIIDGSIDVPAASWTYDASNNVWYYQLSGATGGHVTEGSQILRFVEWNTNIATTAAAMYNGTACWNYNTNVIYVRPLGGTMTGKTLRVSNIRTGVFFDSGADKCTVDSLMFLDFSKESQIAQNCHGITIKDCESYRSGGWRDTGSGAFIGGAFGAGTSTRDFSVLRCTAEDVFDSPFSSQLYAGQTAGQSLMNHVYDGCIGRRFGYGGFEWTALSPKGRVQGVYMTNFLIEDGGNSSCWHTYDRDHIGSPNASLTKGNGITSIGGHTGLGYLDRIFARDGIIRRCYRGVRNSYSNGDIRMDNVVIEDSVAADLWVEQIGSPSYPRSRIVYSNLTRTRSPGADYNPSGLADAIKEAGVSPWV
jgi:hypothetical protein